MKKRFPLILIVFLLACLAFQACSQVNLNKEEVFTIKVDQPLVESQQGLILDFGFISQLEDIEIKVRKNQDVNQVMGGKLDIYEFELNEALELDDLVTISLPYDDKNTIPKDEENSLLLFSWDENKKDWSLLPSKVNSKDKLVSFSTVEIGSFALASTKDPKSPYGRLARLANFKYENPYQAQDLLEEYLNYGYSRPQVLEEGLAITGSLAGLEKEINALASFEPRTSSYASELNELSLLEQINRLSKKVSVNQAANFLAQELYEGKKSSFLLKTKRKVQNNSEDYYDSPLGKLSILTSLATDYSLDSFEELAQDKKEDDLYKLLNHHNQQAPWSQLDWYRAMIQIYEENFESPLEFNEELDQLIYDYSGSFFQLSQQEKDQLAQDLNMTLPSFNEEDKENSIELYTSKLGKELQPILKRLQARISNDISLDYLSKLDQLVELINSSLSLEVAEWLLDDNTSILAQHSLALVNKSQDKPKDKWTIKLDEKGWGQLDISVYDYLQAGAPQVLDIYKDLKEAPIRSQELILEKDKTNLYLEASLPSFDEILGSYPNTSRNINKIFLSKRLEEKLYKDQEQDKSIIKALTQWDQELVKAFLEIYLPDFREEEGLLEDEALTIIKTGENKGTFNLGDGLLTIDYHPQTGLLEIGTQELFYGQRGQNLFWGQLFASHGADKNQINLEGFINTNLFQEPQDLLVEIKIQASKP